MSLKYIATPEAKKHDTVQSLSGLFRGKLAVAKKERDKAAVEIRRNTNDIVKVEQYLMRRGNSQYAINTRKRLLEKKQQLFVTYWHWANEVKACGDTICRLRACKHERTQMRVSELMEKYLITSSQN